MFDVSLNAKVLFTKKERKVILDPKHSAVIVLKKFKIIFICFKKLRNKILKGADDVSY
jgi:hypothetical protein